MPERQIRNLAKAYAWCVAKEGVTLSILKVRSGLSLISSSNRPAELCLPFFSFARSRQPITFTSLRPTTTHFLTLFFTYLILSTQTASPLLILPASYTPDDSVIEQTIMKIASIPSLAEGILYFLTTAMGGGGDGWLDKMKGMGEREKEVVVWGVEVCKESVMMGLQGRSG